MWVENTSFNMITFFFFSIIKKCFCFYIYLKKYKKIFFSIFLKCPFQNHNAVDNVGLCCRSAYMCTHFYILTDCSWGHCLKMSSQVFPIIQYIVLMYITVLLYGNMLKMYNWCWLLASVTHASFKSIIIHYGLLFWVQWCIKWHTPQLR